MTCCDAYGAGRYCSGPDEHIVRANSNTAWCQKWANRRLRLSLPRQKKKSWPPTSNRLLNASGSGFRFRNPTRSTSPTLRLGQRGKHVTRTLQRSPEYGTPLPKCNYAHCILYGLILYCMGPESRPPLDTFSLSADELLSYETVIKRFIEHFVHPANELYESSLFHKRTQEPGESVDAYYAELCRLVKHCNYPFVKVEERLVRDRFVVGLRDARLTEQLCRNSKLSLKEAWTQARQWEDTKKEKAAKGTAGGFSPVELDAAKAHKAPRRLETRQQYAPLKTELSSTATCSFCGRSPHPHSECPVRAPLCNHCRKDILLSSVVPVKQKRPSSPLSTCILSSHPSKPSTVLTRF